MRKVLVWLGVAAAIGVPVVLSVMSPLLAWRQPVYIAAGAAGVGSLALLLLQPLLIAGDLPGLAPRQSRLVHRWLGVALIALILIHVGGLWVTSPPDVVDALLFRSPTPFSAWGVVAMWAAFGAALLAGARRRSRLTPAQFRRAHAGLAAIVIGGTVVHALLIDGTMESLSKAVLCVAVVLAALRMGAKLRLWRR